MTAWPLLAKELVGSPSRLLITCRRPLAALADGAAHAVLLGPLPAAEAALYLREHVTLSQMIFGGDAGEKALAFRLLNASRFHPLLMDRLAKLAAGATLRPQLMAALETLEKTKDFAQLPTLFATIPGNAKELAYLADALASSLDQLIRDASPDARRLLWLIAVANQPEALVLIAGVWSGEETKEQQQLRQIKPMLDRLTTLPEETQAKLQALPPEIRATVDALPPEGPARPNIAPLLRYLVTVGLATEEHSAPEDANPNLSCHELIRERIRTWMDQHRQDRAALTENAIRLAYAQHLESVFNALLHQNMTAALEAGSRALVYCVQAEAWDRLGGFASELVTSARDPGLLAALVPHLQTAAEAAPEGKPRWSCLGYLADALRNGGRPDTSLPFYGRAATQACAVAEAGGGGSRQAWSDLGWITGNWAHALFGVGDLGAARQRHLDSAEAAKKAGRSAIYVIMSELEAFRIAIMQGEVVEALPEVEARLARVEEWWQQHRAGQPVPEAPDVEDLARALISALNIANNADRARNDFESALRRTDAILELKRALKRPVENIAGSRTNRAVELGALGRFDEAQAELQPCLQLFQNDPARTAGVRGTLATLFYQQGDVAQAITQGRRALALRDQLPDPAERASSHNNLAIYLGHSGTLPALAEAPRHQLASLIYRLVTGLGQDLQDSLGNYTIDFRRARAAGIVLAVPRAAELLADPTFAPLVQWLGQGQVDVAELQADVDQRLDQARQAALAEQ